MRQNTAVVTLGRGLNLLLLALFFLVTAAAAEEAKPAQRKRLAGIKPFTTEQRNDFLSERRNATILEH